MKKMKSTYALAFGAAALTLVGVSSSQAQVPLSAYADANGFIDVQALTCAQLAGTFQEDADNRGMVQRMVQWSGEETLRTHHAGEARRASGDSILQAAPRGKNHSRHRRRSEGDAEIVRSPDQVETIFKTSDSADPRFFQMR
jgi:hypothetical protein